VDDALGVGGLERFGDAAGDPERVLEGNRPAGDALLEGLALGQLHDQEALAVRLVEAVDRRDVGVVQGGEQARLAVEASEPLRVFGEGIWQQLERHRATQLAVLGAVHLAHPALAELAGDPVMRQRLSDHGSSR
jgi:hypothetical protein